MDWRAPERNRSSTVEASSCEVTTAAVLSGSPACFSQFCAFQATPLVTLLVMLTAA